MPILVFERACPACVADCDRVVPPTAIGISDAARTAIVARLGARTGRITASFVDTLSEHRSSRDGDHDLDRLIDALRRDGAVHAQVL